MPDYSSALDKGVPTGQLAFLHNSLGQVLLTKDRYADSIQAYSNAIALEPGNADLYMSRCAAEIRCGRFFAALADLWRGMRIKLSE